MIAPRLLDWFDHHGRHDLPWQHPRSAYRVWLSEIMLQQTQVATVIDYFTRFVTALPTLPDLAAADDDTVLALWSGLGYYRRARFMHRAAQQCMTEHDGQLPRDFDALVALPGIGRSTAGAILAQAHGLNFPILDGNVKRVLARHHGIHGYPGTSAVEKHLWQLAESHTPDTRCADYTQAIMDLGATVCTRAKPRCAICPLTDTCVARQQNIVDQLPERRPSKTIPTRHTVMLVIGDTAGRILLEKRGPQGVWAGLWSLPEAINLDAAHHRATHYAHIGTAQKLTPFKHTFSHYHLDITPLLFSAATPTTAIADHDRTRWCTRQDADALGLPAPVRTLLHTHWPDAP